MTLSVFTSPGVAPARAETPTWVLARWRIGMAAPEPCPTLVNLITWSQGSDKVFIPKHQLGPRIPGLFNGPQTYLLLADTSGMDTTGYILARNGLQVAS